VKHIYNTTRLRTPKDSYPDVIERAWQLLYPKAATLNARHTTLSSNVMRTEIRNVHLLKLDKAASKQHITDSYCRNNKLLI